MLQNLIRQVRFNCQLSSGAQAGLFSLCGLLLRLRQLYKWEHDLLPWQEPESPEVLDWIAAQESAWDEMEDASWDQLLWNGGSLDPFAVDDINLLVQPEGLIYGAGFGRGLAPTFFLGELTEVRTDGDLTIFVVGDELARDLDGAPAMAQGNLIYARTQALVYYLWDRFSDPGQQNNRYLKLALASRKLCLEKLLKDPKAFEEEFCLLVTGELEAAIRHEIGEAREESLRPVFKELVELFPHTRIELWIRGLKDALADVNEWGRLAYLIQEENLPSLALFFALAPGLYPLLIPEIEPAFRRVAQYRDWRALNEARLAVLARLRSQAAQLQELLAQKLATTDLQARLHERFLAPLGL
ncbi:MAG: hypothetical protein QME75_01770 [Deltaproteobacteria bacterium]|nr:hypothetical protein [Deltaproteobacteria bacterium]